MINETDLSDPTSVIIFESNSNQYFKKIKTNFEINNNKGWQNIHIPKDYNSDNRFQPILGFGGSITDSSCILFKSMNPQLQKEFLNSYFSENGLCYSVSRIPIQSTDFSCRDIENKIALKNCDSKSSQYMYYNEENPTYSHQDMLNDFKLQEEDLNLKISVIKSVNEILQSENREDLKLIASPWSAPAFMKTNNHTVGGFLKDEYYDLWSDFIIKFLDAYKTKNISFFALTMQNEPLNSIFDSFRKWQSMYFTNKQKLKFIKDFIGPKLHEFSIRNNKKTHLLAHDDQIHQIHNICKIIENDPEVSKYISGISFHWYMNWLFGFSNINKAYNHLHSNGNTSKFIISSEACNGFLPFAKGPRYNNWDRGQEYSCDIINCLKRNVISWIDWNLVLDMKGGPNWAGNNTDAPVLFDPESQKILYQPMFYHMGHFSKFIRPGSIQVNSISKGPFPLEEVCFVVPKNSMNNIPYEIVVLVILNRDITGRKYYIYDETKKLYLNINIGPRSIQTILYNKKLINF